MRRSVLACASLVFASVVLVAPAAQAQDGGGRRGRGGPPMAEALKEPVGLNDEQVTKVKAIDDEVRADMQKIRDEMQQGGNQDRNAMRDKMTARRDKARADVRALLTAEQQPKFDAWVKQDDERRNARGQGGRGGQGRGGPGGRDPERENKRLYDQAEKDLTLTSEEKSAVMPLVKAVIDARSAARTQGDKRKEELSTFLKTKTGATEAEKAEIAEKLKDLRKANEGDQDKVKQAENALREVLTIENEAKLIVIGVLR